MNSFGHFSPRRTAATVYAPVMDERDEHDDELEEAGMLIEDLHPAGGPVAPANPDEGIEAMQRRLEYLNRQSRDIGFLDPDNPNHFRLHCEIAETRQRIADYERLKQQGN